VQQGAEVQRRVEELLARLLEGGHQRRLRRLELPPADQAERPPERRLRADRLHREDAVEQPVHALDVAGVAGGEEAAHLGEHGLDDAGALVGLGQVEQGAGDDAVTEGLLVALVLDGLVGGDLLALAGGLLPALLPLRRLAGGAALRLDDLRRLAPLPLFEQALGQDVGAAPPRA
jgi:hypothetical protein